LLVCTAGDTHGNLDLLYELVSRLESALSVTTDLVVQVGDLGVWPDPDNIDGPAMAHDGAGDLHRWIATGSGAPRPTIFIPGNHEDFPFLLSHVGQEIVPDLHFLPWGEVTTSEARGQTLRIGGLGGCYSPVDYWREVPREPKKRLRRKARGARKPVRNPSPPGLAQRLQILAPTQRSHFLRVEEDALIASAAGNLDILLLHDCPTPTLTAHLRDGTTGRSWTCDAVSLGEVVTTIRPRLCLHGHFHAWHPRELDGVPVVSLQKVSDRPYAHGCVALLDVPPEGPIRTLAMWDGTEVVQPDLVFAEVAPPAPPPDPGRLLKMGEALERWRAAVLDGEPLTRAVRRRTHAATDSSDLRRVMLAVLRGRDPVRTLERLVGEGISVGELPAVLAALPDASTLRDPQ
jgi:hypothetical protein